jgi:hypothetical protein
VGFFDFFAGDEMPSAKLPAPVPENHQKSKVYTMPA